MDAYAERQTGMTTTAVRARRAVVVPALQIERAACAKKLGRSRRILPTGKQTRAHSMLSADSPASRPA